MPKTIKRRNNKSKSKRNRTFKKRDFVSGDGMLTSVWGPSLWHYLHTMSFNYPWNPTQEQKHYYKKQILLLKNTLPCKYCRTNLKNNFKHCPLRASDLKNRDTFSRYVYQLHETVNKMLGKKSGLTYCDVRERYEHFRARCLTSEKRKEKIWKFPKTRKKKESGCTEPLYGKKSKCVLQIVPHDLKGETFKMHKDCEIKR
tara:strand:+ start:2187 stop:2786 length:600 start_codon:yes stop_codon:yes gene_type:complete